MIAKKLAECLEKVISDDRIAEAIKKRDRDRNFKLESIHTKIIRTRSNDRYFQMIVRIGFDYLQRVENDNVREDILVDVLFTLERRSNVENIDIKNVNFVPDLPST